MPIPSHSDKANCLQHAPVKAPKKRAEEKIMGIYFFRSLSKFIGIAYNLLFNCLRNIIFSR